MPHGHPNAPIIMQVTLHRRDPPLHATFTSTPLFESPLIGPLYSHSLLLLIGKNKQKDELMQASQHKTRRSNITSWKLSVRHGKKITPKVGPKKKPEHVEIQQKGRRKKATTRQGFVGRGEVLIYISTQGVASRKEEEKEQGKKYSRVGDNMRKGYHRPYPPPTSYTRFVDPSRSILRRGGNITSALFARSHIWTSWSVRADWNECGGARDFHRFVAILKGKRKFIPFPQKGLTRRIRVEKDEAGCFT